MPGSTSPQSDSALLARIARSPGGKAGYKQLVREFGLGGGRERRLLLEQLNRLVAAGALRLLDAGHWALPARPADSETSSKSPENNNFRSGRDRLLSGRLELHRDGFGFVRPAPETRLDKHPNLTGDDIFIPPPALHGAMHGDLVLVDEDPPNRDGRRSGRIARVLTRRNQTIVGIFHYGGRRQRHAAPTETRIHGNFVQPWDDRVGGPIEIPPGAETVPDPHISPHRTLGPEATPSPEINLNWPLEGLAVEVEITTFPQPGHPALGRILEVLGPPDAFGVDVEIVIRKHAIPHTFPAHVLADADQRAAQTLTPAQLTHREDFRSLPIVTIDGETARDFDDAVLVRPLPNGHTELQVHIADVSAYVLPSSPLDTEARVRGTSVYFPDRAVPMLPHALSSGMCSLLPNEDRLVLSCIMEIDPEGEILGYRVAEGVIRSLRRMTYTAVQHCLNASPEAPNWNNHNNITPEPTAEDTLERERIALEHPELPAAFDRMLHLALQLNRKRVRRGSIDFDLPEPVVEFDPDGNMKAIVRSSRGWSHRLIEEFMLSANECVATWLTAQGIPSLYRIHEMPDPKRIVDFEETAAAFGQTLGIGALPVKRLTMKSDRRAAQQRSARGRGPSRPAQTHELPASIPVTPQMYQRLVRKVAGKPEERILSYLMLRSLKQARYAEQNQGHFALASPCYTHFTSPIRRYPDLIVHRLLRAMLQSGANPQGGPLHSADPQPWAHTTKTTSTPLRNPEPTPTTKRKGRVGWTIESPEEIPTTPPLTDAPIPIAELADIAAESSQAERRAADAERELIEWKKMKFMAGRIGDDFPGLILSITKFGFFVELDELFIEGLVPLASLTHDFYTFRDADRVLCGARTGHCFRIGDRVQVILDRIDRQQRRLQFALLPGTEPQPEPRTPRPPKSKKSLTKPTNPKPTAKRPKPKSRKRR